MTDVVGSASFELRADRRKLAGDVREGQDVIMKSVTNIERRYAQGGRSAAQGWARGQRDIVAETKRAEAEITASSAGISRAIAAGAGAFIGAVGVNAITTLADQYTRFANQLRVAGVEGAQFEAVQDRLAASAVRNGVELESLGTLYGRSSVAAKELGASQADLLRFTDGVSAALRIQGGSAASSSGALLQLSQAISGNVVRAEEFNSILEGARPILTAVASGSDRFGGSISKLREAVNDGTVTSREFFQAFLKGSKDLEAQAAQAPLTVAAGFTNLNTALVLYVGQSAAVQGATGAIGAGLTALSQNLDLIIPSLAAITVGLGVAYVGGAVAAIGTTANFTKALGGLRVAMLAVSSHPIIAALTILAAGFAFVALRGREATASMQAITTAASASKTAIDAYEAALRTAANASGSAQAKALDHAAALRAETVAALQGARAQLELARTRRVAALEEQRQSEEYINSPLGMAASAGPYSSLARAGVQQGRQADVRRAQDEEFAAGYAFASEANRLATLERQFRSGGLINAPAPPSAAKATKGASGPSAEDLAVQREMLRLQGQLEVLKAQGRDEDAEAVQRQIDLINLTKQYTEAGFDNAADQAKAQIDALAQAEDVTAEIDRLLSESEKRAARQDRAAEIRAEAAQRENDLLLDRLGYEAELARLSGDPTRIRFAERELFIAERVNELLRLRKGLITEGEAKQQAGQEFDALDSADREGQMRDEFRRSFRDGIRAALDGDVGGLFESLADRFTDRMLDNLADDLFDLLSDAAKGFGGGKGGGGFFSTLASIGASLWGGPGGTGSAGLSMPKSAASLGAVASTAGAAKSLSAGASVIHVTPSKYFDVQVQRVAEPLAERAYSRSMTAAPKLTMSQTAQQQQHTVGRKIR